MTQPRKEQLSKLITGSPIPANVNDSSTTGSSSFASLADHTHAHGIHTDSTLHQAATSSSAGFMSSAQATQLVSGSKGSVKVATTANITLSGPQTIDGISIIANDRVLVKDQTSGFQNGIYIVNNASWTRTTDFNTSSQAAPGTSIFVEQGSINIGAIYILITQNPIILDTTVLTFSRLLSVSINKLTMASGVSLLLNQGAATPASVTGTADITAAGLYGGGGSLTGKNLKIDVGSGVQTLTWNGATNAASKTAMLAAISAFFVNGGVVPVHPLITTQGGSGGNKLIITSSLPIGFINIDASSTSLSQLGLSSGLTVGVVPQEHPFSVQPISSDPSWSMKLFTFDNIQGTANNIFKQGWNVDQEDVTKPALYDSFDWNGQDISATNQCFNHYWFATGVGGINPITPLNFDYDTISGNSIMSIDSVNIHIGTSSTVGLFLFGSVIERFSNSLLIDQVSNIGPIAEIDAGTSLTHYMIRANTAGQHLYLQATSGDINLSTPSFIMQDGSQTPCVTWALAGSGATSLTFGVNVTATYKQTDITGAPHDLLFKAQSDLGATHVGGGITLQTGTGSTPGSFSLEVGTNSVASTGMIRLSNASAAGILGVDTNGIPMVMRNFANSGDLRVFQCNSADDFVFGSQDPRDIYIRCSRNIILLAGAAQFNASSIGQFGTPSDIFDGGSLFEFSTDTVAPFIKQIDLSTSGAGNVFSIYAQKGNGTHAGGIMKIGGGASGDGTTVAGKTQIDLGAAVSHVSAEFDILIGGVSALIYSRVNSSTFSLPANTDSSWLRSTDQIFVISQESGVGVLAIENNSNSIIASNISGGILQLSIGDSGQKLGFFGASVVSQRTITDSTSGTPSASLAALTGTYATDVVTLRNWGATLLRWAHEIGLAGS